MKCQDYVCSWQMFNQSFQLMLIQRQIKFVPILNVGGYKKGITYYLL